MSKDFKCPFCGDTGQRGFCYCSQLCHERILDDNESLPIFEGRPIGEIRCLQCGRFESLCRCFSLCVLCNERSVACHCRELLGSGYWDLMVAAYDTNIDWDKELRELIKDERP